MSKSFQVSAVYTSPFGMLALEGLMAAIELVMTTLFTDLCLAAALMIFVVPVQGQSL